MSPDPTPDRAPGGFRRVRELASERLRRAGRMLGRHHAGPNQGQIPAEPEPSKPRRFHVLAWILGAIGLVVLALGLFLANPNWNWARGPVTRIAAGRMHREVAINGDLRVHLFSWQPSAVLNKVHVGNPAWAGQGHTADLDRLLVQIKLAPLFRGELVLLRLEATRPDFVLRRDLQGRATWDFSNGQKRDKPLKLPPIRRFVIDDGHINLIDEKRKLRVNATLEATERLGAANRGFRLEGDGSLNGNPFLLRVLGGPLLNVDPKKPYPFNADIRAGATHVTAQGDIPKPFDLGVLQVNLTAQGPDLENLYDLTGVAFPNTPPYELRGHLSRDGRIYRMERLSGRIGRSDIAGGLTVDTTKKRMFLKADLASRSLDFRDMSALFGGKPTGKGAQPSSVQPAPGPRRLLPDATLKVERVRSMDADVHFKAHSIHDAVLPLRAADVRVKLDGGVLTAQPITFDLPQGRIQGQARLDARPATPVTDVDLRLTGARLEQLLPVKASGQPLTGALIGRVRLHGAGDSVHRAASHADGEVLAVVPGGEIRRAFAELMGIDVTKGLGLLLAKNQDKTEIRCAIADFKARNGVLTADRVVFDTGPVLATGSGSINLNTEQVDLRVEGHPKEFRLVRLMAPITAKGPILGPPKLGVDTSKAVAQGGFAAVLASVASPLAAILPFIDPGLAKDASCGALIAEAGGKGAPVKTGRAVAHR